MARSTESKKEGKKIARQIAIQRLMLEKQKAEKAIEREENIKRIYSRSSKIDNEIDSDYDNLNFIIDLNNSIERRGYV